MALNFPTDPNNNDTYALGNRTWKFNGDAWELQPLTGGYTGSQGYTGSKGDVGYTGSRGDTGITGYTGSASTAVGYTGSQGDIGYTGSSATNITVSDFSAGVIDDDLTSVAGTHTTIPTAKATKDYVDNQVSGAAETKPTITSISPSTVTNDATSFTITGTNFTSVPIVEAVNSSTGAIVRANSVSFTSSTSISANFTITVDGTYFIRVENNDGYAVRSTNAILTVSDAPVWSTSAGTLGTFSGGGSVSATVSATSDSAVTYSVTSGSLPTGISLNSSTGAITGTESGATEDTTYSFTIRATDGESQTADRAFSITITVGINNGVQFN